MTVLSRLLGRETATKIAVTDFNDTLRSYPLEMWDSLGSRVTSAGEHISVTSALRIVTVYACVRVLAETVASLPLNIYRKLDNGGREEYYDHPLYNVLHYQPNPDMTSFVWRETLMNHLATWGNAYCEITKDYAGRMQLWPLRPDRMEVYYDDAGRRRYDYIQTSGQRKTLKNGSVFHVPGLSSNGLKGYSPIALHREALGLYTAAQSYGTNVFRNNARPAVVLSHPKTLSPQAIDRLSTQMEQLKGSANAGKTVVLEEGLTLNEIGFPPEDAQYIETRKFQMQEIARMFRVPPHMIGDLERATFSNIEHQSIDFVNHTIRPWLQRIRQEIKAQLLYGEDDVSVDFRTDELKQGDALSVVQALNVERNAGVISTNEWRAVRKRNPIPGGDDDYWRPLNMGSANLEPLPDTDVAEADGYADVEPVVAVNGDGRVLA